MTMIYNMPEYAKNYDFMAVTTDGKDFWFYGAYANIERASAAAAEIGGFVINTETFW